MLHKLQKLDFSLGVMVMLFGGYCFYSCLSFDALSQSYPMFISLSIFLMGVWIAITPLVSNDDSMQSLSAFFHKVGRPLILAGIYLFWALLLQLGVGYLLASIVATFIVLIFIGSHKFMILLLFSLVISSFVYLVFGVLFDIPLPEAGWLENFLTMIGWE